MLMKVSHFPLTYIDSDDVNPHISQNTPQLELQMLFWHI